MRAIQTELAPAAIGTYSQAMRCGPFVFLSGQIPLNPETMALISDDPRTQIEQVFRNLSAVCDASGGQLTDVVKLQVYLTDLGIFPLVNEVISHFFSAPYPARAVVQVAALPRGAQIEIDGVMYCPE